MNNITFLKKKKLLEHHFKKYEGLTIIIKLYNSDEVYVLSEEGTFVTNFTLEAFNKRELPYFIISIKCTTWYIGKF